MRSVKQLSRIIPIAAVLIALAALGTRTTQAHKGITSPYNFNKDTFPVFRDNCSVCHYPGGPGPMSLLTYKDDNGSGASAWGQSIVDFIISEQMPPWYVDPLGPPMKGGYTVPVRDLDKLLTWAAGGSPEGEPGTKPNAVLPPLVNQWRNGPPDLKLTMDADHTLPPGALEDTKEFVLETGLKEARWVRGIDLLPGKASMARAATISVDQGPVLSYWVPGTDPVMAPNGAAFKLPAGAKIRLEMFYKKSYLDEQNAVADRSSVGLYFTDAPVSGREIQSVTFPGPAGSEGQNERTTSATFAAAGRIVAVRPALDQPYVSVKIDAVIPNGRRIPLLWLRSARPEWRRRYWLVEPIELPSGSKIEVRATPFPSDAELPRPVKVYPFQIALEFVPQS
jgi:hypothetical protein